MPDITLCLNKDCDLKNDCFRYVTEIGEDDSYSMFRPHNDEGPLKGQCGHYLEIKPTGHDSRSKSS